jgi:hypothetical protein
MSENPTDRAGTCIRCGRCCQHFSFFAHVNREEWTRVLDHVKTHHDGRMRVWQLDGGLQRFILKEFSPTEADIEINSGSELFHPPGNAFTICPFFFFDFDDGAFSCEIHGPTQPRACTSFFCGGSDRFGVEMEYCDPCWIEDADDGVLGADHREKTPPCEIGKGCRDFTYRILFFLAYTQRHPRNPGLTSHASYLLTLIGINEETFASELISKGLDSRAVQSNLEPLAVLKNILGALRGAGKRILDFEQ